jgi:hypothetical protein
MKRCQALSKWKVPDTFHWFYADSRIWGHEDSLILKDILAVEFRRFVL